MHSIEEQLAGALAELEAVKAQASTDAATLASCQANIEVLSGEKIALASRVEELERAAVELEQKAAAAVEAEKAAQAEIEKLKAEAKSAEQRAAEYYGAGSKPSKVTPSDAKPAAITRAEFDAMSLSEQAAFCRAGGRLSA